MIVTFAKEHYPIYLKGTRDYILFWLNGWVGFYLLVDGIFESTCIVCIEPMRRWREPEKIAFSIKIYNTSLDPISLA